MNGFLGRVRCRNARCPRYDPNLAYDPSGLQGNPALPSRPPTGTFDPGEHRIVIQYRNFRGDDTEYVADARTIRIRKAHVSFRMVPTGRRIALWKNFIQTAADLTPHETRP